MSETSAVNCYRIFLGRDPESKRVAQERALLPLTNSIAEFIASEEFDSEVLAPLLNGDPLPHCRLSILPGTEIKEWAAAELPLKPETQLRVLEARTWRHFLSAILVDPTFVDRVSTSTCENVFRHIHDSHLAARDDEFSREIVGAIDKISALEIRGWAANLTNLSEAVHVEFLLDNKFIGAIKCNLFRRDTQEVLGDSGLHGFSFVIPAAHHQFLENVRLLSVRDVVSRTTIATPARIHFSPSRAFDSLVEIRRDIASLATKLARIESYLPEANANSATPLALYEDYQRNTRQTIAANRGDLRAVFERLDDGPLISVIVGEGDRENHPLAQSVKSLQRQVYSNWECLVCDWTASAGDERKSLIEKMSLSDERLRRVEVEDDGRQSRALRELFDLTKGTYILVMSPGDRLSEDALLEMVLALKEKQCRVVYFDEDVVEADALHGGHYRDPKFKPDFDYDFLLASNYIGTAFLFEKAVLESVGGGRDEFPAAQLLDALLRMVEAIPAGEVLHIARVLYHRFEPVRHHGARGADGSAVIDCVNAHLERSSSGGRAEPHIDPFGKSRAGCCRIIWPLSSPAPKVSIIVPTRDRADLLEHCLQSVLQSQGHYPTKFEIIVVDNDSCEPRTAEVLRRFVATDNVRVLPFRGGFNWSALNNTAARQAEGDVLLFLNNDTVVLSQDWIRELVSTVSRPNVGAVGARLLYEDGTLQHAGVLIGVSGGAIHEGMGQLPEEGGYLGRTALQRNVLAVTGACLATRATTFRELGGFDEANLKIEFNDTDYCLRLCDRGLSVIYTPFATLYHFESKSRGFDKSEDEHRRSLGERTLIARRWEKFYVGDRYYNEHFDRFSRPFSRLRPITPLGKRVPFVDELPDLDWA